MTRVDVMIGTYFVIVRIAVYKMNAQERPTLERFSPPALNLPCACHASACFPHIPMFTSQNFGCALMLISGLCPRPFNSATAACLPPDLLATGSLEEHAASFSAHPSGPAYKRSKCSIRTKPQHARGGQLASKHSGQFRCKPVLGAGPALHTTAAQSRSFAGALACFCNVFPKQTKFSRFRIASKGCNVTIQFVC